MSKYLVLGVYFLSIILSLLDFSKLMHIKYKKMIFCIFCILLVVISFFKGPQTSFDTGNYCAYYERVSPIYSLGVFQWFGYEPFYLLLNSLVKTIGLNYHFLFAIITIFVLFLYGKIIFKYSDYIFISLQTYICCFYFLNETIIIRFGIASAIILYNIKHLEENNYKKAIITVLVATMFHYTAIVGFVPVILYNKHNQFNRFTIYMVLLATMTFILMFISPLTILDSVVKLINNENLNELSKRVLRYRGNEESSGIKRVVLYVPYFILAIMYFINTNKRPKNETNLGFIILLYFSSSFFFMFTCNEVASLSRLNALFLPINIISNSKIINCDNSKTSIKIFYFFLIIIINTYIFFRQVFFNSGGSINLL